MLKGINWGLRWGPELVAAGVESFRERMLPVEPGRKHTDMGFGPFDPRAVELLVKHVEQLPHPLYIATPASAELLPKRAEWECLNEPNLGLSAEQYVRQIDNARAVMVRRGLQTPWCGSIANLSRKDLDWLAKVLELRPDIDKVSVHRYPRMERPDKTEPNDGFDSVNQEFDYLMDVLDGRRWRMTETGRPAHVFTTGWWFWKRDRRLGEQQQLALIRNDFRWAERHGAEAVYLYQSGDAPIGKINPRKPSGQWGARTHEGRWKAAIKVFGTEPVR